MPNKAFYKYKSAIFTLFILTLSFSLSLFFPDEISRAVKRALSLSSNVIIPSVFPFIIISDYLYSYTDFGSFKIMGRLFERIFKINKSGLYAFTLGLICGFPLGVRCASELYENCEISKDEYERLIGFSNNTGPAFLICGIGLGLRGSVRDGIILYFSMLLSAITVGALFSIGKKCECIKETKRDKKPFYITESIKNAGLGTLNICS